MRRLQRGLNETTQVIVGRIILADVVTREVVKLEAKEVRDAETATKIRLTRRNLDDENQAIADLDNILGRYRVDIGPGFRRDRNSTAATSGT